MISLSPLFPTVWIVLAMVVCILVLIHLDLRTSRFLFSGKRMRQVVVRAFVALLLLLALLNPIRIERRPDPREFQVLLLGDVSGSMLTRDLPGNRSRLNALEEHFDPTDGDSLIRRLQENYTTKARLFGEEEQPAQAPPFSVQSGRTSIGDALTRAMRSQNDKTLAAVVLITDGVSNKGRSLIAAAKDLRSAGVPITVLGAGTHREERDLRIEFLRDSYRFVEGEPFELEAGLFGTAPENTPVRLRLFSGGEMVDEKQVSYSRSSGDPVTFQMPPGTRGTQTYSVEISGSFADFNQVNNVAYTTVEIVPPARYQALLLAANPGWNLRFFRQAAMESEQLDLQRIIAVGSSKVYVDHTREDFVVPAEPAFPKDPTVLEDFDLVFLDIELLPRLTEEFLNGLYEAVSQRGIGIAFFGGSPGDLKGSPLEFISPVVEGVLTHDEAEPRTLAIEPSPVFLEESFASLTRPPGPFLPRDLEYIEIRETRRGAREILFTLPEETPVAVVQAYGAGRSAYLSTEHTWRWRLESDRTLRQHRLFWSGLMQWLATGGKTRIDRLVDGRHFGLETPIPLDVSILDGSYQPESGASVTARVYRGSNLMREVVLNPSLEEMGRFEATFLPDQAGPYRVDYTIRLEEGETLDASAYFSAIPSGEEMADVTYREEELRDATRLTGGRYMLVTQRLEVEDLPLSRDVPVIEIQTELARTPFLFILIGLLLVGDWLMRRKEGLK